MSPRAAFGRLRGRFGAPRLLVWGGLLAVLAAAALWPYAYLFNHVAGAAMLGAALVGYLPRRRWSDALWLGVPAAAVSWIEPGTATQVFALVALPCFVLTLRPRFAVAVAAALMTVLLAGIRLKLHFGGSRLTWQDVRFFFVEFRDNVTVFGSQPTLLLYVGLVLAALGGVLWGAWAWDGRTAAVPARPRWRGAAALLTALVVTTSASGWADAAARIHRLGPWNGGMLSDIAVFPFAHFLHTASLRTAWVEPLVSSERFAGDVRQHMRAASHRPADIVLFLQESQFNPAMVEGCPGNICTLPVFGADSTTRAFGPLRVHTFGGGTWLSEFEVATGVPHSAFGDAGGYAPFTVAPGVRRSFPRSLRAAGYHTVAIYPVGGNMMNARKAYQAYGYDAFYDSNELGVGGGYGVSDRTMHAAALRVLEHERRQGKPVLLTVVTIFNHSQHGVRMERVPSDLKAGARSQFHEDHRADILADYLWRTGEFQAAMQQTQQKLLGAPQPAVLAWFGDHQPPTAGSFALKPADGSGRAPANLQTWYRVSSNVPAAGKPGAAAPLDIVFLPGLLAEAAGAALDELLAANVAAREQCGGLLRECALPEVRDSYLSYLWRDLAAFELP